MRTPPQDSILAGFGSVLSVFAPIPSPPYLHRHFAKVPVFGNEAITRDWETIASDLRVAVVKILGEPTTKA